MAGEAGTAYVRIRPNFTGFRSDVQQGVKKSMSGDIFSGLAMGAKGATLGIGALAGIVGVTGFKFDQMRAQAQIAFTTMLGSGTKAKDFLDQLQKFAAATPFEFKDLTMASQRLLAMGFTAKQVLPTMTAVGNAAAAMGGSPETIERVTTALGQIKAKGKLAAEEMRQLTEAGIPAWNMLATKIGVSVPQAMKLVTKGAVDSNTAVGALVEGMNTKFAGMMDKQSHTFAGLWSTVKDTFSQITGAVMKPFFDMATQGLQKLVDVISTPAFAEGAQKIGASLKVYIGDVIEWLKNLWTNHWKDMKAVMLDVWDGIQIGWALLKEGMTAIDGIAKAFGGWKVFFIDVVAGFAAMKVAMFAFSTATQIQAAITAGTLRTALISTGIGAVAVAVGIAVAEIIQHWSTVRQWLTDFGNWISGWAKRIWDNPVLGPVRAAVTTIIDYYTDLIRFIKDVFQGHWSAAWHDIVKLVSDLFGNLWNEIKKGAYLALLAIVEPFSHLPKWLGGGWAQDMKKGLESALSGMQSSASDGGTAIGNTLGSNIQTAAEPYIQNVANMLGKVASMAGGAFSAVAGVVVGAGSTKGVSGKITPGLGALEATLAKLGAHFNDDFATSGHAANSFHYRGEAADITPNAKVAAYLYATRKKYAELFIPTNLPGGGLYHFGQQFADAALQEEHQDHIHVAYTGHVKELTASVKAANVAVADTASLFSSGSKLDTGLTTTKKKVHDVSAAVKENLATAFEKLKVTADKLGDDMTPGIKAGIAKVKSMLGKVVTTEDAANVRAKMGTIRQAITEQLHKIQEEHKKHIAVLKSQVDVLKSSYEAAFGRIATGFDAAFDRATQNAIKALQISVRLADSSFLFGGSITQTPAEKSLSALQKAHDDAQREQALNDAIANGDAVAQAAAEYDIKVAALQAQADLERTAATDQLQTAQENYQAERDLLKEQMDQRVALIEQGMENGNISAASGLAQLNDILNDPTLNLDLRNSGIVLGGNIYDGLKEGFKPVFDLLDELIRKMKDAGVYHPSGTTGPSGAPSAGTGFQMLNPQGPFAGMTPQQIANALQAANQGIIDAVKTQTEVIKTTGGGGAVTTLPGRGIGVAVAR